MVGLLFTLPVGKDMETLPNYYLSNMQISTCLRRYSIITNTSNTAHHCEHFIYSHKHCTVHITLNLSFMYSTQDGWTPLLIASFMGHVYIVRMLIEAKAQINTAKEVCLSVQHYSTHHMTSHSINKSLLYICGSAGWVDFTTYGGSRRQS